ncbi:hypothetical protein DFJ73DRAFT_862557, partial [Zopfochytrium polystomum]
MTSQTTSWIVAFVYNDLGRKIHIPTNTGFDGLLQLVAARFQISPAIELVDAVVLDTSDDLPSLLSQNYKWKVLPVRASATENVAPAAAGTSSPSVAAAPAALAAPVDTAPGVASGGNSTVAAAVRNLIQFVASMAHGQFFGLIPDNWECKSNVQKHPFFI